MPDNTFGLFSSIGHDSRIVENSDGLASGALKIACGISDIFAAERAVFRNDGQRVLSVKAIQDSLGGYLACFHSCDGRLRQIELPVQDVATSPVDEQAPDAHPIGPVRGIPVAFESRYIRRNRGSVGGHQLYGRIESVGVSSCREYTR